MDLRTLGCLAAALCVACGSRTSNWNADGGSGSAAVLDSGAPGCIDLINHYRSMVGAPPVGRKVDEEECAAGQSADGVADWADSGIAVFHRYFGACHEGAQTQCWDTTGSADDVLAACMALFYAEGPPPDGGVNHYSIMTGTGYTTVACGSAPLHDGGYWMTGDYY